MDLLEIVMDTDIFDIIESENFDYIDKYVYIYQLISLICIFYYFLSKLTFYKKKQYKIFY